MSWLFRKKPEVVKKEPLLSDAPATTAAAAAPVAEPMDLSHFAAPTPVPAIDPELRRMLLNLGLNIHAMLVRSGKFPEDIATLLGLDEAQVDSVLLGRNADIKISTMFRIAKIVGGQLQTQVVMPVVASTQPEPSKAA